MASNAKSATPSETGANEPAALRRIVVGTDFSDAAKTALRIAGELAATHGAELVIVHAVDPMIATLDVEPQAIIDDVRAGLQQVAAPFVKQKVKATTQMRLGKAWWAIDETAREVSADLVIIASHGRTGIVSIALGSTADRTIRSCRTPVLVAPATWTGSAANWKAGVVGVDFSEESAIATSMAARLLARSTVPKTNLVLFHTIALTIEFRGPDAPVALPQYWDQAEANAAHQLEGLAATLRNARTDVRVATHRGYPSDGLLSEARSAHADFIAVGTHGRHTVNRMLLGSVAERVLHHAQRPVLAVRHPKADAAVQIEGAGSSPPLTI